MSETQSIYDVKDFECLRCKITIPKCVTMANAKDGKFHKGMIVICSNCTLIMVLGDSQWRPMSEKEFKSLPPQTQVQISTTVKGLRKRIDAGGSWNPYEKTARSN